MGFDFYNAKDKYYRLNQGSFGIVLKIARKNGWEPQGVFHFENFNDTHNPEDYEDDDSLRAFNPDDPYEKAILDYLNSDSSSHVDPVEIDRVHEDDYLQLLMQAKNIYIFPTRDKRGSYTYNNGQVVKKPDAFALGDAILKAADSIPKKPFPAIIQLGSSSIDEATRNSLDVKRGDPVIVKSYAEWVADQTQPVHVVYCQSISEMDNLKDYQTENPETAFSSPNDIDVLKNFAAFCQGGAFYIY